MIKLHEVVELQFDRNRMKLTVDGKTIEVDLAEVSDLLTRATEPERNTFEISPSGYGIHWPLIDEDLSIDSLLGITHAPKSDTL